MDTPPLDRQLTQLVLEYLGVPDRAPDRAMLDALMAAYVCRVPWESATRIAKRAATADTEVCPRWPEEFWTDALERGSGGTCFESNLAFFSLLRALGYDGYLTINDMGSTTGCHTATIIRIGDDRLLVDAGFPVHAIVPVRVGEATRGNSPYQGYTLRPEVDDRYALTREPHPSPYCFTLIDCPVPYDDYREAATRDYGPEGLFLDQVIVTKVIDGRIWRFAANERPYRLASFSGGIRTDHPIDGDLAETIGKRFGLDIPTIRMALEATSAV
jgi:arylamine N-acetyltransferase